MLKLFIGSKVVSSLMIKSLLSSLIPILADSSADSEYSYRRRRYRDSKEESGEMPKKYFRGSKHKKREELRLENILQGVEHMFGRGKWVDRPVCFINKGYSYYSSPDIERCVPLKYLLGVDSTYGDRFSEEIDQTVVESLGNLLLGHKANEISTTDIGKEISKLLLKAEPVDNILASVMSSDSKWKALPVCFGNEDKASEEDKCISFVKFMSMLGRSVEQIVAPVTSLLPTSEERASEGAEYNYRRRPSNYNWGHSGNNSGHSGNNWGHSGNHSGNHSGSNSGHSGNNWDHSGSGNSGFNSGTCGGNMPTCSEPCLPDRFVWEAIGYSTTFSRQGIIYSVPRSLFESAKNWLPCRRNCNPGSYFRKINGRYGEEIDYEPCDFSGRAMAGFCTERYCLPDSKYYEVIGAFQIINRFGKAFKVPDYWNAFADYQECPTDCVPDPIDFKKAEKVEVRVSESSDAPVVKETPYTKDLSLRKSSVNASTLTAYRDISASCNTSAFLTASHGMDILAKSLDDAPEFAKLKMCLKDSKVLLWDAKDTLQIVEDRSVCQMYSSFGLIVSQLNDTKSHVAKLTEVCSNIKEFLYQYDPHNPVSSTEEAIPSHELHIKQNYETLQSLLTLSHATASPEVQANQSEYVSKAIAESQSKHTESMIGMLIMAQIARNLQTVTHRLFENMFMHSFGHLKTAKTMRSFKVMKVTETFHDLIVVNLLAAVTPVQAPEVLPKLQKEPHHQQYEVMSYLFDEQFIFLKPNVLSPLAAQELVKTSLTTMETECAAKNGLELGEPLGSKEHFAAILSQGNFLSIAVESLLQLRFACKLPENARRSPLTIASERIEDLKAHMGSAALLAAYVNEAAH